MHQQKKITPLILGIIFLLMLALNILTPMYLDDYAYCFSWKNGERITSIGQIFPSMQAHASIMNGRLFCHFLVQLSFLLPRMLFKTVNAGMFVALLVILKKYCELRTKASSALYILLFGVLWYILPAFGQVMFWQDGSINYLWGSVFSLLFLLPYVQAYNHPDATFFKGKARSLVFLVFGFFVGGYSEVSAFSVIGGVILFLFVSFLFERRKPTIWMLLPVLSAFAGFFFMLSMPAERMNKTDSFGIIGYLNHFMDETAMYYKHLFPLLAVWIILFIVCIYSKMEQKTIINSICFLLISLAANYILVTATVYPERVMLMCTLYLILACGTLLLPLFHSPYRLLLHCSIAVFGLIVSYTFLWGSYDIYRSHHIIALREDHIQVEKEQGNSDIVTPYVDPWTKYSVTYHIQDLDSNNAADWPNPYVAKYYEINSILGCEPNE